MPWCELICPCCCKEDDPLNDCKKECVYFMPCCSYCVTVKEKEHLSYKDKVKKHFGIGQKKKTDLNEDTGAMDRFHNYILDEDEKKEGKGVIHRFHNFVTSRMRNKKAPTSTISGNNDTNVSKFDANEYAITYTSKPFGFTIKAADKHIGGIVVSTYVDSTENASLALMSRLVAINNAHVFNLPLMNILDFIVQAELPTTFIFRKEHETIDISRYYETQVVIPNDALELTLKHENISANTNSQNDTRKQFSPFNSHTSEDLRSHHDDADVTSSPQKMQPVIENAISHPLPALERELSEDIGGACFSSSTTPLKKLPKRKKVHHVRRTTMCNTEEDVIHRYDSMNTNKLLQIDSEFLSVEDENQKGTQTRIIALKEKHQKKTRAASSPKNPVDTKKLAQNTNTNIKQEISNNPQQKISNNVKQEIQKKTEQEIPKNVPNTNTIQGNKDVNARAKNIQVVPSLKQAKENNVEKSEQPKPEVFARVPVSKSFKPPTNTMSIDARKKNLFNQKKKNPFFQTESVTMEKSPTKSRHYYTVIYYERPFGLTFVNSLHGIGAKLLKYNEAFLHDEQLKIGDHLLEINGDDVATLPFEHIIDMITSSTLPTTLMLESCDTNIKTIKENKKSNSIKAKVSNRVRSSIIGKIIPTKTSKFIKKTSNRISRMNDPPKIKVYNVDKQRQKEIMKKEAQDMRATKQAEKLRKKQEKADMRTTKKLQKEEKKRASAERKKTSNEEKSKKTKSRSLKKFIKKKLAKK